MALTLAPEWAFFGPLYNYYIQELDCKEGHSIFGMDGGVAVDGRLEQWPAIVLVSTVCVYFFILV